VDRLKGARHDHLQSEKFGFALLIAALPVGFALAAGGGGRGGAIGAGVGAAGMGSAAVGSGAPAGAVGGGPPAVRWAADRRDRTTRPAMEQLERATQAGMPAASPEMAPMLHRDNKRHDHWRRHRWRHGRSVRARACWRYLANRLNQATRIWPRPHGPDSGSRRCRGGAIIDNRTSQARTRRCVDGDSGAASMWRSGSRNRRNDDCIGIPDRSPNLSRTR